MVRKLYTLHEPDGIYDFILDDHGINDLNLINVELQKISNNVSQSIDKFFLGDLIFLKLI